MSVFITVIIFWSDWRKFTNSSEIYNSCGQLTSIEFNPYSLPIALKIQSLCSNWGSISSFEFKIISFNFFEYLLSQWYIVRVVFSKWRIHLFFSCIASLNVPSIIVGIHNILSVNSLLKISNDMLENTSLSGNWLYLW